MTMFKAKKAITEMISFVLLTLLIVVASSTAYFFSQSLLDSHLAERDEENMAHSLSKMNHKISQLTRFDGSTQAITVSFSTGQLHFKQDQVIYNSLVSYSANEEICKNLYCIDSHSGHSKLYFSLPGSYIFSRELKLSPGTYFLTISNKRGENEIDIIFKN